MKKELQIALAKGVKAGSEKLAVGRHDVSGLVRVNGQVVVLKDTDKKATSNLMSVDFLLLTLKMAGVTREAAMSAIASVAGGYLVDWKGTKEDKKAAKKARQEAVEKVDPDGKMRAIFDKFADELPRVPVSGAVTFEGHIEEVTVKELEEENNVVEIGVKTA